MKSKSWYLYVLGGSIVILFSSMVISWEAGGLIGLVGIVFSLSLNLIKNNYNPNKSIR